MLIPSEPKLTWSNIREHQLHSVCWGGNISKFDGGRLEKIVRRLRKAGLVVGRPLDSFQTPYEERLLKKTNANIE